MTKKNLMLILRIALGVVAVVIIYKKVDFEQATQYLKSANWLFLLMAFASFFTSKILAAFRINYLYRQQDVILDTRLNIKLNLMSMFYNLFIPLVGGEGYRAIWLKKRYPVKVKNLVSAALLDRVSGLVALCFLSIIFFQLSGYQIPYKWAVIFLVPVIYLAYHIGLKILFRVYLPVFWQTNILSFLVQILQAVTTYFILMALGVDALITEYIFVFLISTFAYVLPMIGAREMAFVFGAEYLGLNMEISLAIGLLFYLSLALSSLIGGYFVMFPSAIESKAKA